MDDKERMGAPVKQPLIKKDADVVEYVPYGSQDKIKLSVHIVKTLICVPTKSGKICSDRDAIKFLAMIQAKRINPFEGDAFLVGYDTKDGGANFGLITAHQTYLKRAELHPEFDGMKSGIIVQGDDGSFRDLEGDFYGPDDKVVGGWATVYFKGRKQPMHKRLRLARFQKPFGVWQEDPAGMICKCAEADALRSSFPTMLGGLYLREEIEALPKDFARPVFAPTLATAQTENGTAKVEPKPTKEPAAPSEPKAEPEWDPISPQAEKPDEPPAKPAAEAQPGEPGKPVKHLRALCKMGGVKEGVLLDFLSQLGATDGSVGSLEELQLQFPQLVQQMINDWADVSRRIKEAA